LCCRQKSPDAALSSKRRLASGAASRIGPLLEQRDVAGGTGKLSQWVRNRERSDLRARGCGCYTAFVHPGRPTASPFPPMDGFGKSAIIGESALPVVEERVSRGTFDTVEETVGLGTTRKLVLRLEDGAAVECVVIGIHGRRLDLLRRAAEVLGVGERMWRHPEIARRVKVDVCISTQVGCAVGCRFCASSLLPFGRSLSVRELLGQLETARRTLLPGQRLARVFYAGIGEPLLNYENVSEVVRYLWARHGIASTVNTSGVLPALERLFAERLPVNLIVSLHAPNDRLRAELIPLNHRYPLRDLLRVLAAAPPWMFVELKYLMLRGVNDSIQHADELGALLDGLPILLTLQIYNRIEELTYERSAVETIRVFADRLRGHGIRVGMFNSNIGEGIGAGCGQLRLRDLVRRGRGNSRPDGACPP
jgi:23S rRNA (adenine2503-C2)-methyltransferase